MRTTPALALVAAFLASSAVEALSSPGAGLVHASANLHRRTCHIAGHHPKRRGDNNASGDQPGTASAVTDKGNGDGTSTPQPYTAPSGMADDAQPKKMHKKKSKGKCALKSKPQGSNPPTGQAGAAQGGDVPPITGASGAGDGGDGNQGAPTINSGSPGGGAPPSNGDADHGSQPGGSTPGQQPGSNPTGPQGYGDQGAGSQGAPGQPAGGSQGGNSKPPSDGSEGQQPKDGQSGSIGGSPDQGSNTSGQGQKGDDTQPEGYSAGSQASEGDQGKGVHCKGMRGSTTLPSSGKIKPDWFSPDLIHHGPGTQFGGPGLWQGGACMYDDMPHHDLPSVAMDQSFFQDGLACGTCVEIASTDASLFSNRQWSVEEPHRGTLPDGKKTVAIVSDLCPGVDQCYSGLDMHLDAWNSVTNNANGSKLPINWKFVNCKAAFESGNSGIKKLQVHWRSGASPGFFQVQIRGNYEAVVRVEMKWGHNGWAEASHVDSSYWKWDLKQDMAKFHQASTPVAFRITDWQGETITSEVSTIMGTDLFFDANFDRVSSSEQA